MANVRLEKSQIESAISNVTKFSNEMSSQLTELYSVIATAKEVWQSNSGSIEYIDNCSDSVKSLNSDYNNCCTDFVGALRQIMTEYELEDARTSMSVSSLGGTTVASMAIGAGGFSSGGNGFDFSKISKTATDAANGNFVDESTVHNSAFGEGDYTFEYRNDGTVRIDKNGVPMAFTTAENADKITGGVTNNSQGNGATNVAMQGSSSEKRSIKQEQMDGVFTSSHAGDASPLQSNPPGEKRSIKQEQMDGVFTSSSNTGTTSAGVVQTSTPDSQVELPKDNMGFYSIPQDVLNSTNNGGVGFNSESNFQG